MERHWVVTDYLNRMCGWISVALAKQINEISSQEIDFRGWRFRFVFNDELEQLKPNAGIEVFGKKKIVIFNLQKDWYDRKGLTFLKNWADEILSQFFGTKNQQAPAVVFGDDTTITDAVDYLIERNETWKSDNIHTVDFVIPFAIDDHDKIEEFIKYTIDSTDELIDVI